MNAVVVDVFQTVMNGIDGICVMQIMLGFALTRISKDRQAIY